MPRRTSPWSCRERALLVMVRTPFKWSVSSPIRGKKTNHIDYAVLVVAAYSNAPEDFLRGVEGFDGLLKRISIAGGNGLRMPEEVRGALDGPQAEEDMEEDGPPAPQADEHWVDPDSERGETPGAAPSPGSSSTTSELDDL